MSKLLAVFISKMTVEAVEVFTSDSMLETEELLSPEAKDSHMRPLACKGTPVWIGGYAKVANGALPMTKEGEISGAAGELGRGKSMSLCITSCPEKVHVGEAHP